MDKILEVSVKALLIAVTTGLTLLALITTAETIQILTKTKHSLPAPTNHLNATVWLRGDNEIVIRFNESINISVTQGNCTGSMKPAIDCKNLVIINKKPKNYVLGDIIIYNNTEEMVMHRIVRIENGTRFTTKGDSNAETDTFRPSKKDVKGKVLLIIYQ